MAAWQQGGDEFPSLVYEENIGRMTGTMSYDSHVHPFTYNFTSLLSGWAPWTLLMLLFTRGPAKTPLRKGKTARRDKDSPQKKRIRKAIASSYA